MKEIENRCCNCATEGYPCWGSICPNRKVTIYRCDKCGCELEEDEIYDVAHEELCEGCLKETFRRRD